MKKTISINIAGVVFHIEEDGYSKLKDYIASIQRYFSTYPDSSEIIADIESRIAERFLNKQSLENKQAITMEDVDELILAMGTVADFAASEQSAVYLDDQDEVWDKAPATPKAENFSDTTNTPTQEESYTATSRPNTIYRDLRRKILGGVASGIAHRFSVDPLWVRLLCIFLVTGFPIVGDTFNGFPVLSQLGSLSGIVVLLYIAMWIAFPGSTTLEDDKNVKKFYRNPDKKVMGGVASGLASYFNVDTGVIRFLFIIGILFFGTGFLLYIVLWIIAPTANTITEKMQMQGQPITLSNIEDSIKKKINVDGETESKRTLTNLLLLPFTIISAIIAFLEKFLRGFGPIIRIIVGTILTLTSAAGILSILIGSSLWVSLVDIFPIDTPVPSLIFNELPTALVISVVIFFLIPGIIFLLLGLTLLANRPLVKSSIWIVLAGLLVISVLGAAITGSRFSKNFLRTGEYTSEIKYSTNQGLLTLSENKTIGPLPYDNVWITLKGYEGDSVLVQRTATSKGRTVEEAQQNARNFQYNIFLKDSTLFFDNRTHFTEGDQFRAQGIIVTTLIPYEQEFRMTKSFFQSRVAHAQSWENPNLNSYNLEEEDINWEQLRWQFTRGEGLICLNMPDMFKKTAEQIEQISSENFEEEQEGVFSKTILRDAKFEKVNISSNFVVTIHQSSDARVKISGNQEDVKNVKAEVNGSKLSISSNRKALNSLLSDDQIVKIDIYVPTLKEANFSGAVKSKISGFTNINNFKLTATGACETDLDMQVDQLTVDIVGASTLTLEGSANSLKADITGASTLNAEQMNIAKANIAVVGASTANLGDIEDLQSKTAGASKINTKK